MTLAEYLASSDLSYTDFARIVGVTDSTVLRWAKGDRSPSAFWASQMEDASKGAVAVSSWPRRKPRRIRRPGKRRAA